MNYYNIISNLNLRDSVLKNTSKNQSYHKISGNSLILKHCRGNIGHWINDHYYSFYVLATRSETFDIRSFDNILIPAKPYRNHAYIALNCLPVDIQKRVIILDEGVDYSIQNAYIGCTDRKLSFRENNKTLIEEMRSNFLKSIGAESNENNGIFIYQNNYPHDTTTYGRRILNLPDVKDFLKSINRDVYCVEGTDWFTKNSPEFIFNKLTSFRNFLGPWGAWSCNLILAPAKSRIHLLIHPDNHQSWYENKHTSVPWSQSYLHNVELGNYFNYINPQCISPTESPPGGLQERMKQPNVVCDFIVDINSIPSFI